MSSARDHHAKADQLLGQAHAEQDSIRRGQILAEAQVHATLALSAPAGKGPPSPGQTQTGSTAGTPGRDTGWSEGSGGFGPQPHAPSGESTPGSRYPPGQDPRRQAEERRAEERRAEERRAEERRAEERRAEERRARGNQLVPPPATVAAPAGFSRTDNPPQPVPRPVTRQPEPGDPGKEEPGDPDDKKLRGPGGLRPS